MTHSFNHYLITRFNVSLHWPEGAVVPPSLLDYRLEVFEKLCFPSVVNQSSDSFRWMVLFDADTPPHIRRRVERLARRFAPLQPLYLPRHDPGADRHYLVSTRYSQLIVADGGLDRDFLVTSRLDNDDAIAGNYVESIQSCLDGKPESFVNFTDGYLYDLVSGDVVRSSAGDGTNTITFIEQCRPGQDARTVYFFDHHRNAADFAPVSNLSGRPGWIIGVHGDNIMNNMEIHPVTSPPLDLSEIDWRGEFGVDLPVSLHTPLPERIAGAYIERSSRSRSLP